MRPAASPPHHGVRTWYGAWALRGAVHGRGRRPRRPAYPWRSRGRPRGRGPHACGRPRWRPRGRGAPGTSRPTMGADVARGCGRGVVHGRGRRPRRPAFPWRPRWCPRGRGPRTRWRPRWRPRGRGAPRTSRPTMGADGTRGCGHGTGHGRGRRRRPRPARRARAAGRPGRRRAREGGCPCVQVARGFAWGRPLTALTASSASRRVWTAVSLRRSSAAPGRPLK